MTIVCTYFSPTTPTAATWSEDLSGYIRLGTIMGLSAEARMGATGVCSQVFDDAGSTIGHAADGVVGLKQMLFDETACPAGNQRMWTGYIGPRDYRRGQNSLRLGADREIDVTLVEVDDFLSFRVFAPEADDPTSDFAGVEGETDLERVQRMLTTVDFLSTTLADIGYIPSTGGVVMSAKDYTGARPIDVLNDCAQASGRNFFVLYDEATNQLVLWYDVWDTDGTATLAYDSALRLTNVDTEHDGATTFAVAFDAHEVIDPSRVVSATYLTGENGLTGYRTLATTANKFAWRDSIAPSMFVKDQTKLNALGDRYLGDNATEDPRIFCTVQLPAAKVTGIHKGQRLQVHFTHLPVVKTTFTWTRVMALTIRQDKETPDFYWLDLELSPIPQQVCPSPLTGGRYPANNGQVSAGTGNVAYTRAGSAEPGFAANPGYDGGGWNFALYNQDRPGDLPDLAGYDLGGTCVTNQLVCLGLVGDGTIEIQTIFSSGSNTHLTAWLEHDDNGAVIEETQENIVPGSVITFNVTSHDGTFCTHRVRVRDTDPGGCGNGWGFAYFDWTRVP